jgi:hypothetical protein
MSPAMMILTIVMLLAAALGLSGCAAALLAPLGAGALSGGAGAVVRAGTEYTRGGTVLRTFSMPSDRLREVVSETFARMELAIHEEELDGVDRHIVAHARGRVIVLTLQPLTRTVTRARLSVSNGRFSKDRATASEIIVQLEQTAESNGAMRMSSLRRRIPD